MTEKKYRFHTYVPFILFLGSFFILCHVYIRPNIVPVSVNLSDSRIFFSLPSFGDIMDVEQRKFSFFTFIKPIVESENRRILKTRRFLMTLFSKPGESPSLSEEDTLWITITARKYGLESFDPFDPDMQNRLLKRVDTVPLSLALAQAANESAWGTSRFARLGNNLFGQWTYKKGSGLIPEQRDHGKNHEVSKFISVNASVRNYMHNLNTHRSYKKFRSLRHMKRAEGLDPTGHALAEGLLHYSSRGTAYIESIRAIIRNNEKYMTI